MSDPTKPDQTSPGEPSKPATAPAGRGEEPAAAKSAGATSEPAKTGKQAGSAKPSGATSAAGAAGAKPGSRGRGGVAAVIAIVAVVVILGGLYLAQPLWRPALPPEIERVVADVLGPRQGGSADVAIGNRGMRGSQPAPPIAEPAPVPVAPVPVAPVAPPPSAADEAASRLAQRVDSLSGRLDTLEQRLSRAESAIDEVRAQASSPAAPAAPPPGASPEAVERLDQRIGRLETATETLRSSVQGAGADATSQALVLAVGRLHGAMETGRGFAAELSALRRVAGQRPPIAQAVDRLAPYAQGGVSTAQALRQDFDVMARRVVQAAVAPDGSDWWSATLRRLSAVVTVRRTGDDVTGDTPSALVAQAEAELGEDNLAGAVATLERLIGAPAAAAAPWLEAARARLQVLRALETLETEALAALSGGQSGGQGGGQGGG